MKSLRIKITSSTDVKRFLSVVQKYPFDISLRNDSYLVDAKSVLGLFSLDLTRPIDVEIREKNTDELIEELSPFSV